MNIKLPFFQYFIICITTSYLVPFIDRKFNISYKLFVKFESIILVIAFELIVMLSLLILIALHTNIDTFINPVAAGIGIASVRKVQDFTD